MTPLGVNFMRTPLFPIATLALVISLGYGQVGAGDIAGRLTDPSGASIPNATVIATNVGTGGMSKTVTDGVGDYELLKLQPGDYTLSIEAAGFKKLDRAGVTLRVADRLTMNLTLEIGHTTETVNVTGEAPLLRTQDEQTGD